MFLGKFKLALSNYRTVVRARSNYINVKQSYKILQNNENVSFLEDNLCRANKNIADINCLVAINEYLIANLM